MRLSPVRGFAMASERIQRRIDRLLDQIEEAVDQLEWTVVQERASAVLAIDPNNSDGLAFLVSAERALAGVNAAQSDPAAISPASATPASASDQPTSFANGRYQVKEYLGEGGKKTQPTTPGYFI